MIAAIRRSARANGEGLVSRARMVADAAALEGLLEACEAAGVERHALVLRLSGLPPDQCRPHHVRLAHAALDPLLAADRARLFLPSATDAVLAWRGEATAAVRQVRAAVAHLFSDIPGASTLIAQLLLPGDAAALRQLLADAPAATSPGAPDTRPAMDLSALALLERRLAEADVSRFTRRRPIRRAMPDGRLRLAWEKRFLSVAELSAALLPEHAASADPWLFCRLTRTLDRRMLTLLSAPGVLEDALPFSINLNVASLLAPEFLRFDAALPTALRGQVVLDLLPADVLADPAAFAFARDFARAHGYRLLLRLSAPSQLMLLPMERVGVDFVQLRWTEPLAGWTPPEGLDVATLVLGRAGGPAARAWGRARGVGLFAGD